MGKQAGPNFITGTVGKFCYYKLNGQYYVRAKSTLSRKRVKRSPRFQHTMEWADLLGVASKIAAGVYRSLPMAEQRLDDYRAMTGAAMRMLKEGMDKGTVRMQLEKEYLPIIEKPAVAPKEAGITVQPAPVVIAPVQKPVQSSERRASIRRRPRILYFNVDGHTITKKTGWQAAALVPV